MDAEDLISPTPPPDKMFRIALWLVAIFAVAELAGLGVFYGRKWRAEYVAAHPKPVAPAVTPAPAPSAPVVAEKTTPAPVTTTASPPPATTQAELMAQRVDAMMTDYPASIKMNVQFDWSTTVAPPENLSLTPYAYVMNQGDQIWLNYVNLFVRTIKLDGRLKAAAEKNKLGPIVAP